MKTETMLEHRATQRAGWLRSAVFTANGGIVALAGLIAGVSAAAVSEGEVLVAGVAGLVAGAVSLAAAIYGSTMARTDGRLPPLVAAAPEAFVEQMDVVEIAALYRSRGLAANLAEEAALAAAFPTAPLAEPQEPRPLEAAITAATSFAVGAAVPVTFASLFPLEEMALGVGVCATVVAAVLAGLGARGSDASVLTVMARISAWSVAAIGGSYLVGSVVGTALA